MSLRRALLTLYLRLVERRYLARATDFPRARARMEAAARILPMPPGPPIETVELGGRPALMRPGRPLVFWLHGGAYCLGSPATHAAMVAALARRLGGGALLPDYRLAPEHAFPAALEDAARAWEGLGALGVAPGEVVLGGDSAGGGLAFALLHGLIATGGALPRAVVGFSPWIDLTGAAESLRTLARREALLPIERFDEIRDLYLAGADPRDPRASPIFGRFVGAPPVFLQSSRHEALRDDSRALAAALRRDGVAHRHDEWGRVFHVWQLFQGRLPEADAALDRAAAFLRAAATAGEPGRTPRTASA